MRQKLNPTHYCCPCDAYLATNKILYAIVQTKPIFGLLSVCHLHFSPFASNPVPKNSMKYTSLFFSFFRTALDDLDVHVSQTQCCVCVGVSVCVGLWEASIVKAEMK